VLDGKVAVVFGGGPLADGLSAALTDAGARVDLPMGEHVDLVVHSGHALVPPMAIEDMHDMDIATIYDGAVRVALMALQSGRAAGATRFVLIIPSMAETGAAGFAALCAATEAVRLLALGAARQWREDGVTVNCLATAFPFEPEHVSDLAPAVVFLASEVGAGVSGVTIPVGGPAVGL
jgi:NAD(P)-dependent dehydrogenase (short-subunit alcohol dehydrogenase family)